MLQFHSINWVCSLILNRCIISNTINSQCLWVGGLRNTKWNVYAFGYWHQILFLDASACCKISQSPVLAIGFWGAQFGIDIDIVWNLKGNQQNPSVQANFTCDIYVAEFTTDICSHPTINLSEYSRNAYSRSQNSPPGGNGVHFMFEVVSRLLFLGNPMVPTTFLKGAQHAHFGPFVAHEWAK